MTLDDRIGYLLLGFFIGFVLGYLVQSIRIIKEKVTSVENKLDKKEEGSINRQFAANVVLFLVVMLVAWTAFSSQKISNDVKVTQGEVTRVTTCTQEYLSKTISALNERTKYTSEQAKSNVELQEFQTKFLKVLLTKPPNEINSESALKLYVKNLQEFADISKKKAEKVDQNPYPTNPQLTECVANAMDK